MAAVRWGAIVDKLLNRGYTSNPVSSHSLRSKGVMALKLARESLDTIMRVGQWTSLTYMSYIQIQIRALPKGLAWRMSKNYTFHHLR